MAMDEEFAAAATGVSGLDHAAGYINEEFHPRLRGKKGVQVYREMRDNSAIIGGVLYIIEALVKQAELHVQPKKAMADNAEAKKWAEFVEQCMTDMDRPWSAVVSEILTMLPFGWALMEWTLKQRRGMNPGTVTLENGQLKKLPASQYDDGKFGWASIELRAQETLESWKIDDSNNEVQGMWQLAPPLYQYKFIPLAKCALFRVKSWKNNPEGRSILRNAYRAWYFQTNLEEIEAVGMERDLAGLPVLQLPPSLCVKDELLDSGQRALKQSLITQLKKIRRNQWESVVMPSEMNPIDGQPTGYKLGLLSSGGSRQIDISGSIKRYQTDQALSMLAEFILLGTEPTGSFSLSSDKTDMFSLALGALLKDICEVINLQLIRPLMEMNGVPQEYWPEIVHDDVEAPPLDVITAFVTQLAGAGVLRIDDALEERLREWASLPPAPKNAPRATGVDEAAPPGAPPTGEKKPPQPMKKEKWWRRFVR